MRERPRRPWPPTPGGGRWRQPASPPSDVDLTVVATISGDQPLPATAAFVQADLGLGGAAFDVAAACAGFIYGLELAGTPDRDGRAEIALVMGTEVLSKFLDWGDRTTCVLFGDGAGAVVVRGGEEPGLMRSVLGSDGRAAELLQIPAGGSRRPASSRDGGADRARHPDADGKEVFKRAVEEMADAATRLLKECGTRRRTSPWSFRTRRTSGSSVRSRTGWRSNRRPGIPRSGGGREHLGRVRADRPGPCVALGATGTGRARPDRGVRGRADLGGEPGPVDGASCGGRHDSGAVVVGASGGIGGAVARALASRWTGRGVRPPHGPGVGASRWPSRSKQTADRGRVRGRRADEASVARAFEEVDRVVRATAGAGERARDRPGRTRGPVSGRGPPGDAPGQPGAGRS